MIDHSIRLKVCGVLAVWVAAITFVGTARAEREQTLSDLFRRNNPVETESTPAPAAALIPAIEPVARVSTTGTPGAISLSGFAELLNAPIEATPATSSEEGKGVDLPAEEPTEELDWLKEMDELKSRLDDLEEYQGEQEEKAKKAADAAKSKKKSWYEKLTLRGYAQIRLNEVVHEAADSFPAYSAGDSGIGDNQSFTIRRARIIISGDVHEHLGVYLQPDFASAVSGAGEGIHFVQIRDWYGDLYLDTDKVHRLRIGQSKVPYGWENLQSSSNRLALDRNDAFNSGTKNERDLGVFYYWTPEPAQEFFKYVVDEGLKGSGNYGILGFGFYNGQGGSLVERNDNLHTVARITLPGCLPNGNFYEIGMQGYTGKYNPTLAAISPLGVGPTALPTVNRGGVRDERLGWTLVYYPQPLGFQAEWTVGNGPSLNDAQDAIVERPLHGGYVQTMYRHESDHGVWIPFTRYINYEGGYKSERNSPYSRINETEIGLEWQINPAAELTTSYTITNRTNTAPFILADTLSYGQFDGNLLRFQFQFNY
jgi:hypothetical protein